MYDAARKNGKRRVIVNDWSFRTESLRTNERRVDHLHHTREHGNMGIFKSIMDKIFHHSAPATTTTPAQVPAQHTTQPSIAPGASAPIESLRAVDVDVVLTKLALSKGGGGNWRTSIVDLLKLLDLDSSLAARKELAQELNVRVGADGSAEQNIALSKAVMKKLAENDGKVPDSLKH